MKHDSNAVGKQRPYLIRAMHDWMTDNDLTPHLVVDAEAPGLQVPDGHAKDGRIVLNVSYTATRGLTLGNEQISFEARFNGMSRPVAVPVDAVVGVYARETGQGMVFTEEREAQGPNEAQPGTDHHSDAPPGSDDPQDGSPTRPSLKIVK